MARVVYAPPVVSVYLDDLKKPVLRSSVDLSTVMDSAGRAYVGFTASTGGSWENHDILSWSFSSTQGETVNSSIQFSLEMVTSDIVFSKFTCLPDRNLCTPDQTIVEQIGPDRYHVVLPAHLAWGASLPSPAGAKVVVTKAIGKICWDLKSLGPLGCNGPRGNGLIAGEGFIAREAHAGALISMSENGRTYFSVNGRRRSISRNRDGLSEFRDHEGFWEFEVEIQR